MKEDKVDQFDFITEHVYSTRFFFEPKIDISNKFKWSNDCAQWKEERLNRICIIGGKNVGKTFVLMRLFDCDKKELKRDKNFIYKKSENNVLFCEPIEKLSEDELKKTIYNSSIIIYVVRSYGYKEQIEVNKIMKLDKSKIVIVIHNSFPTTSCEVRFHNQNYNELLERDNKSRLFAEATEQSLVMREKNDDSHIFHFFLMNNQYKGKKFNIETIRVLNAIIGTFIGLGTQYDENPLILQDKIIPSYEIKKENKHLSIIVKLPSVTDIKVTASIDNTNDFMNFNFTLQGKKEGKVVELKISLPYHEYLVTDTTVDKSSLRCSYGKMTFKFPLLQ